MALFNYVFAKKHGGALILRIEDTDRTRSRHSSEQAILEALRWIGLEWDEGPDVGGAAGPYRQSERADLYRAHADILLSNRQAYRCFCTPERLAEVRERKRREKSGSLGYDRHCRALDPVVAQKRADAGEAHTVRLAVPVDGVTRYEDLLRGPVEFANAQVDDQVLLKSDGFPTYHLANVVDDHAMRISHVIRAEEWITSTPKHVLLYRAFDWPQPVWIHMPLLRNKDKSKISKRKNPVSIGYYREAGILPEALLNFLAIMGWSLGGDREKFTLAEMVEAFSWDKVSLGGPVFDVDKLNWLNELYIHDLGYEALVDRLLGWRYRREHLLRIAPLVRERIKRLEDFGPRTDFFFSGDLEYAAIADDLAIPEVETKDLRKGLLALIERYGQLEPYSAETLEAATRAHAEELGWKTKHLFMVLRLLVTGRKASPPLFETMDVLGSELSCHRLRSGVAFLGTVRKR